jgi:hypothetical protein
MIEALDPAAALSCSAELRQVYLAAFGAPGYDEALPDLAPKSALYGKKLR